jgi:hypothetical protein
MRDPKDIINYPTGEEVIPGIKSHPTIDLHKMRQLLSFLGTTMDNVISITGYHKECRNMDAVLQVAHEFYEYEKPAWNLIDQTGSRVKQVLIEICGMALVDEDVSQPYTDQLYLLANWPKPWLDGFHINGTQKVSYHCLTVIGKYGDNGDGGVVHPKAEQVYG